jgi:hypothetical protein
MIVPSMNSQELVVEISKDFKLVMRKAKYITDSLRREAIKSKTKHVHRVFDYKSQQRNDWLIIVDHYVGDPIFIIAVVYLDNNGQLNGIMTDNQNRSLYHYSSHFLERYNERFLRQENISKKELLTQYLSQNPTTMCTSAKDKDDMKNRFFGRSREGIGLGNVEEVNANPNTIMHFRTFIANDMIFESQTEDFNETSKEYEIYWMETYGYTKKGAFD